MSALFADLDAAAAALQSERLVMVAKTIPGAGSLSTDYVKSKLVAAEADAERRLRVFFEPVTVFAYEPSAGEITALGDDRWAEESAYDYEAGLFNVEDWGYLVLRKTPVIAIESCVLAYPAPVGGIFNMPLEWMRLDKKAGHVRFVPTGSAISAGPLSAFLLSTMAGGRNIPQMLRIRYRAGLQDAATKWPDLVDLVKKMAVLRIVQDFFLPQSGSISADGLSRSLSIDMQSYHDGVDAAIETLLQVLHGPRMMVL